MEEQLQKNNQERLPEYRNLLGKISATYTHGQLKATQEVNIQLLDTYWQIGEHIVEFEQGGNVKAEYGKALISTLAKDLALCMEKDLAEVTLSI